MKKTNYETKLYKSHLRPRITSQGAESGRSMVEMLGVLAIVGVISIGGIAGYIYGMNRYRTNEILDGGNKRAVLVASQLASEITPNLTEFVDYDETAGGTFSSDVEVWENEFGIQVSGVKKEVCENLIRMIGSNTPLRGLVNVDGEDEENLEAGECAEGTNNNLYLVYNLEMLSNRAVDSGSREGSGGGTNCWTLGNCTADDAEANEQYCNGGLHSRDYCDCLNDPPPEGCVVNETDYIECRKKHSSAYCDCVTMRHLSVSFCSSVDSCLASGKSSDCCYCLADGYPEEDCISYEVCP